MVDLLQEFNVAREQHAVQPPHQGASHSDLSKTTIDLGPGGAVAPLLQHQSRSYPGGQPRLARTPSVSSQSSLDSGISRQVSDLIRYCLSTGCNKSQ